MTHRLHAQPILLSIAVTVVAGTVLARLLPFSRPQPAPITPQLTVSKYGSVLLELEDPHFAELYADLPNHRDRITNLEIYFRDPVRFAIEVPDLTPIGSLDQLEDLYLPYDWDIADLTPLTGCPMLKRLTVDGVVSGSLSPLKELKHLEQVDLCGNHRSEYGGAPSLRRGPIDDISPLTRNQNLSSLSVVNQSLTWVPDLGEFSQLENVDLSYNHLSRVRIGKPLPDLYVLSLEGNRLDYLGELHHCPKLAVIALSLSSPDILTTPDPAHPTEPTLRDSIRGMKSLTHILLTVPQGSITKEIWAFEKELDARGVDAILGEY